MSERTTIGGTVYESIGSSSSNLLLKCNGTARIQWGGKLIDLIKNGKIASGDSSTPIFIVSNESEVKLDGIYVLNTDESSKLLIQKDGNLYNLSETDLYISASNKQNITVEQQKQALENIGIYYNTYEELQASGIQNGIVYVIENKTLYTIKDGIISEFEAKLKTVTVEQEDDQGGVINSSFKIVLSILDDEYLVLQDKRITANYPIYIKNSAQIGSEEADETKGYRLYIKGDTSYLDVDRINVRDGINIKDYSEVTFENLALLISSETLEPHRWYLITDFQNHWKLDVDNPSFNRPILLRALTNSSLYTEGFLFKDRQVIIKFDHTYREEITQTIIGNDGQPTTKTVTTKGRIVWMKDGNNNEANFDFLDYTNSKEEPLTTLYDYGNNLDKSIFPINSHDNTLIVHDLKGTVLKNKIIDDSNTTIVDFQINADSTEVINMYDNYIECRGLVISPSCKNFYGNTLKKVCKLYIYNDFINNDLKSVYTTSNSQDNISFDSVENNSIFIDTKLNYLFENVSINKLVNSTISASIKSSIFIDVINCVFNSEFDNVIFKSLTNCTFGPGLINNTTCYSDISNYDFSDTNNPLLYDSSKLKKVYFIKNKIQIICEYEHYFRRGMIMMHSGIEEIPEGWAICDGNEYTFNGVTSKTPNLINRFIKAVATVEEVKETLNESLNDVNELMLKKEHLPKHQHEIDVTKLPQYTTDEITGNTSRYDPQSQFVTTSSGTMSVGVSVRVSVSVSVGESSYSDSDSDSDSDSITLEGTTLTYLGSGDRYETIAHYHRIDWGSENILTEDNDKDVEQIPIKLEPNYYSLIFIMKL